MFSRTLSCTATCAAAFFSLWLLKTVKYRAAVTSAPPAITTPHCFRPDSSLKLIAIGPPLRLPLLAGQHELKRLHVLDRLVLKSFFNLDVFEKPGLLQVCDQIGYRVRAQCRAFQIDVRSGIIHLS